MRGGERGREEGRKAKGLGGVGVCGVGVGWERGWGQPKWHIDSAVPKTRALHITSVAL